MKLLSNKWIILALCIVVLCVLCFFHWRNSLKIDANQVVKIQFGNSPTSTGFNAEDIEKFIKLFNSAKYAGKGTGEGGTPDIEIFVYYKDGSYLKVHEFSGIGQDFEAFHRDPNGKQKSWYYLKSEELEAFVLEMLDKFRK